MAGHIRKPVESIVQAVTAATSDGIQRLIEENLQAPAALVAILQAIQREHGHLPAASLKQVSQATGRHLADVYGVATFYRSFSLHPRGKHMVSACLGTACHVRGAQAVVGELERQLGTRAGGTTPDREFSLETVNCLGACALGPVIVVDGRYFSKVGPQQVRTLLDDARTGRIGDPPEGATTSLSFVASCSRCQASLMDATYPLDGLPSILLAMKSQTGTGWWRVSSRYGSKKRATDSSDPTGSVLSVYCTHCGEDLSDGWKCSDCRTPMVTMTIAELAYLRVCPRLGCDGHMLDVAS